MKKFRKTLVFFLLFVLFFNISSVYSYTNNFKISNDFLEVALNAEGRYSIGTTGGNSDISVDNYKKLLYGHPNPGTSYTTIRVDNTDHYFSGNVQSPVSNELFKTNITEGKFSNVKVKQILSIVKNSTTQQSDTVEIKYIVTNTDQVQHTVGTRIMMDTMLGDNDHAPFRIPGVGAVTSETELIGENIPAYWQAFDDLNNPTVIAHGSLLSVPVKPDKVQFTNWSRAHSIPWDFNIMTGSPNGDSAVNIYWNEKPMEPGETREYVTYYGLSSFISELNPPVSLNIAGPSVINFDGTSYSPNPFTLTAYVQNISNTTANGLKIDLVLPDGITSTTGETSISLGNLLSQEERMLSWDLKLNEIQDIENFNVEFVLSGSNIEEKRIVKSIIINDVSNPVLENIQFIPNEFTIEKGDKRELTLLGYFSDNNIRDISSATDGTTYSTSDQTIAYTSENGLLEVPFNSPGGTVTVTASNGGITTNSIVTIIDRVERLAESITVNPTEISMEQGQVQQLEVKAQYENGTTENITNNPNVNYSSMDSNIAQVNEVGLISTTNESYPGTVTITVEYQGLKQEVIVEVTGEPVLTNIETSPESLTIEQGKTQQLSVAAIYSNGETKDVTSSEDTVYKSYDLNRAIISGNGLIEVPANAPLGEVGIKVSFGGKDKLITLNVIKGITVIDLEVTPENLVLEQGKTAQLTAISVLSNNERIDVTVDGETEYKSYDLNRALVSESGLVQIPETAPVGETAIRVTYGGKYKTVNITVTSSIIESSLEVTPQIIELERGKTAQITAESVLSTGERVNVTESEDIIYKSYDLNRTTVTDNGLIQVLSNAPLGETAIRVTYGGKYKTITLKILSGPTVNSIEVTPEVIELERGKTAQIQATSILSNGETRDVTAGEGTIYKSYDLNRATVSESGLIQILTNAPLGETAVRVTYGGKYKTITLKVISGPTVSSLAVTPEIIELERGKTVQIQATSIFSNDEIKDVTAGEGTIYKSYDLNRATVSEGGLIQVLSNAPLGETAVRVTYGGKYKTITIQVISGPTVNSLEVTPEIIEIERGNETQITVISFFSNGETRDVTVGEGTIYKSYDLNRAIVDENGLVKIPSAAPLGETAIRVTYGGKYKTITIKVISNM